MSEDKKSGDEFEGREEEFFSSEAPDAVPDEGADGEVLRHRGSRLRSPVLGLVVVGLAVWLMLDFRLDLAYFLSSRDVIELGDGADYGRNPPHKTACPDGQGCPGDLICGDDGKCALPINRLVRITGIPLVTRVSKSRVWGVARNYFPLMGSTNGMFISVERKEDPEGPSRKRGVIIERPYEGRLRSLREPDYQHLREYYLQQFGFKFPDQSYLLIDASRPEDKYPYAILYVFLSLLVLFNLYTVSRYLQSSGLAGPQPAAQG